MKVARRRRQPGPSRPRLRPTQLSLELRLRGASLQRAFRAVSEASIDAAAALGDFQAAAVFLNMQIMGERLLRKAGSAGAPPTT